MEHKNLSSEGLVDGLVQNRIQRVHNSQTRDSLERLKSKFSLVFIQLDHTLLLTLLPQLTVSHSACCIIYFIVHAVLKISTWVYTCW